MEMENKKDMFNTMPFIALIHSISKNQSKFLNKKYPDFSIVKYANYIIRIHNQKGSSQEDLANYFSQSKGNIAIILRKLEDEGYIEREVNPKNRRKYILKTTAKGEEIVPEIEKITKFWEDSVGISNLDEQTKEKIRQIARKSLKLNETLN